ncbi:uncharacterized protein LOC109713346 [Ananas comosus]|uniref:Uncharacterized protein LOC109713346 n=2 Tax=Ananas comosus TaxID=4615 RepID=A0A199V828_ANACO|nr:uncharacterized protein LOC109713346 [Ananas comosus]OAY73229.1 hypothetical protein ACMD2_02853 [Ananas comosus]CAD1841645.1 unnamed protein product [Ananas comosus var. bracteatus]
MEIAIKPSSFPASNPSIPCCNPCPIRVTIEGRESPSNVRALSAASSAFRCSASRITSRSTRDLHKSKSNLESLFCYDKAVPEENIEKPVGLSLDKVNIGNKPPCSICEAKGAVLCATCSGSGLYIDSILESQGIIVKVRCLGCGGTGNIMCSRCGGRGHSRAD